jgi:hypothetical protein
MKKKRQESLGRGAQCQFRQEYCKTLHTYRDWDQLCDPWLCRDTFVKNVAEFHSKKDEGNLYMVVCNKMLHEKLGFQTSENYQRCVHQRNYLKIYSKSFNILQAFVFFLQHMFNTCLHMKYVILYELIVFFAYI